MQHIIGFEIEKSIECRHPLILKMTKMMSTKAEKRDQPDLLNTKNINLAVTLHSCTAAPLDIISIDVVRLMVQYCVY